MWLLGFLTSVVIAQSFDFNKAYADYVFNLDVYQKAHAEYVLARGQYLASKTVAAQQKAIDVTKTMLESRDMATSTYLTALRMRIKENTGLSDNDKNNLYAMIDPDVVWYADHKTRVASVESLNDLVSDSNEARDYYQKTTEPNVYKILTYNAVGKLTIFETIDKNAITDLDSKIVEIKGNGDKKTDTIDRAMLDSQNSLERALEKDTAALNVINDPKNASRDPNSTYNSAQDILSQSLGYIKSANNILIEVVRNIKTAD